MASRRLLKWLDVAIWVLVYGGLLTAILGIATSQQAQVLGTWLGFAGGLAALTGFLLILFRARLGEEGATRSPGG